MKKTILFVFILCLAFMGGNASEGWETNFEAAKKKAAAEKKVLLLDFTGSDWCPPCMALNKEVFSQDEFLEYAKDKLILVKLDFPERKAQDPELKKQNEALAMKYGVQTFPTILLMDASGKPFARTGYEPGGVENYIKNLDQFLNAKVQIDAAFDEAAKVQGVERAAKLVVAFSKISDEAKAYYSDVIEEIYKLDPEDTTGFKKYQELLVDIDKLYGEVAQLIQQGKPNDGIKAVDEFVVVNVLKGELKQKALMVKVNCFNAASKTALDEADKLMDEVIAINPSSSTAKDAGMLKGRIEELRSEAK